MSEPREPTEPDARDESLAALLAVPPLDDVTRRRLVRGALDQPMPRASRAAAALSVAAAVAVGLLVGVVLVQGNEPRTTTTAQGAPGGRAAADSEALEVAPKAAIPGTGPITALGDLGDVTKPADLEVAINNSYGLSAGPGDQAAVAGYPCATTPTETLGLVSPSAIGLGVFRDLPVTVFVGTAPDGQAFAVIVRQTDCTVLGRVVLPG